MSNQMMSGGQIAEMTDWVRRLTSAEYQKRRGVLRRITDPKMEIDSKLLSLCKEERPLESNDDTFLVTEGTVIAPSATFDLGDGRLFTVDEVEELEVNYTLPSDEMSRRMNLDTKKDWEYLGTAEARHPEKVKAVIGCLNQNWTEGEVSALLAKPGSPLKGSGAWVREAFLEKRPRYDGKGWIGFPDATSSRWRFRHSSSVCFPDLWDGGAGGWRRGLRWVGDVWARKCRLCLVCG